MMATMAEPTAACPGPRGAWAPVVDHGRCEAKGPCVPACPYDVLAIEHIHDDDWAALGLIGKARSLAHKRQTAYPVAAESCRGCGLCVEACPEHAITLVALATD